MQFHLLLSVLCLGAVYGQYGENAHTDVVVAPSTDSKMPMVAAAEDVPPSGCPIIEPAPAPLHCTYEQVQVNGCTKPTLKCNCPVNEAFVECATCEPTCDNVAPICTKDCKPSQCQCITGHARRPSGECALVEECQQKPTNGPETPVQPAPTAGQNTNAPNAAPPAAQTTTTGSCATIKCESDYDCVEHVGGCVKKSTGNCAVSPCAANHKCVANVGCQLEESETTAEVPIPVVAANADMMPMPSAAHSTDSAHEETIQIPKNQPPAHVICADMKCAPGSVCIEEYGCFTPRDHFVHSKTGGMVESSCENVFCDKQTTRCVHGTCVPIKMPWKLGHVCSQSPCASASMICVDDIGCFTAHPLVAMQQEGATETVAKTDSAAASPVAAADKSKSAEVKTPASSKSTEKSASKETEATPTEHAGTKTETEKSTSKETSEAAGTTKTEPVASSQLDSNLPKEPSAPAVGNAPAEPETKPDASKEATKSKEAAEPTTEEKTPAEPAAPVAAPAEATKTETPSEKPATEIAAATEAPAAPKSEEKTTETKAEEPAAATETKTEPAAATETKTESAAAPASAEAAATETKTEPAAAPASAEAAATETKTESTVAPAINAETTAAAGTETKTEATETAETKTSVAPASSKSAEKSKSAEASKSKEVAAPAATGEQPETLPSVDASGYGNAETLPSMDETKAHSGSVSTCMECEEPRKGMNGQTVCVRKPHCCPGGAMPSQCFIDPCKGFQQSCSKAVMCVTMSCGHCSAMIYDRNMMPVKVGADNCFMPFSTTNDGDMPKDLPDHLMHSHS